MMMAKPTASRMITVPTRKMRPRTRSVIPRMAMMPTSPKRAPKLAARWLDVVVATAPAEAGDIVA